MSQPSAKRIQPAWTPPASTGSTRGVCLFNSLTRTKIDFQPVASGNRVNWYNCGPTVYDSSHMGHARSYITFDIIRRVLRDYFKYDVYFVQNVTDIDDKIIRRARQGHLFGEYLDKVSSGQKSKAEVLNNVTAALAELEAKKAKETDPDKITMLTKIINTGKVALGQCVQDQDFIALVNTLKDALSTWLDVQFGHQVTDNSIFTSLPRRFEEDYNEDMRALNILPPDAVTRVSEFVDEIIVYIGKIINNGYAYNSNGSVYFDTDRFSASDKHFYAKLVPEAFGDRAALAEGEGDLTTAGGDEKRNPTDFALWKTSKPGEPSWTSPWGQGRPGWHIECSVMASELIGQSLDIHSGGIDLRFPHHDNEIAQAEAYYDTGLPWVNYFLHSGHLTITGCKMSKSLKNFITIKEALKRNSARQLRLAFLLHSWKDTLDYSENTMNDAVLFEKMLVNFFGTTKDIVREYNKLHFEHKVVKWQRDEVELNESLRKHVEAIDRALKDNIDTKTACEEVRALVSTANKYIEVRKSVADASLLSSIATYITKLFSVFGCNSADDRIGFSDVNEAGGGNLEDELLPFVDIIVDLRAEIRRLGKQLKDVQLLALGDAIRDEKLPLLGVRIEDYNEGKVLKTRVKFDDKERLKREVEERQKEKEQREAAKLAKKAEAEAKKKAANEEVILSPKELFQASADYSKFDENGHPTHDAKGEELTKSGLKKVEKLWGLQEKKFNAFLARKSN